MTKEKVVAVRPVFKFEDILRERNKWFSAIDIRYDKPSGDSAKSISFSCYTDINSEDMQRLDKHYDLISVGNTAIDGGYNALRVRLIPKENNLELKNKEAIRFLLRANSES